MHNAIQINPDDLARHLGVPEKQIKLPDGRVMVEYDWTQGDHLGEAAVLVQEKKNGDVPLEILGHGPAWLFGALTCAAWPNEVSVFVNPLQTLVPVIEAGFDTENPPETKFSVKMTEADGAYTLEILEQPVESASNVPEMIGYYRNHYEALCVPQIPAGSILFVEGKAVNFVLMSVIRAYLNTCEAVYTKNFGEEQFTCIYSKSPNHVIGMKR